MKELNFVEKVIFIGVVSSILVTIIIFITATYAAFVGYDRWDEASLLREESTNGRI